MLLQMNYIDQKSEILLREAYESTRLLDEPCLQDIREAMALLLMGIENCKVAKELRGRTAQVDKLTVQLDTPSGFGRFSNKLSSWRTQKLFRQNKIKEQQRQDQEMRSRQHVLQ